MLCRRRLSPPIGSRPDSTRPDPTDRRPEPAPTADPTGVRLRRQALDWLKANLAAWNACVGGSDPQAPADVARTLTAWKAESDLAGVRDPDAQARLPEAERKDWRALWADVEGF